MPGHHRHVQTTSVSLLEQLRRTDQADAWRRLVEIYTPLLLHWARQAGLKGPDAADLVQDVFAVLVRKLPEFEYDANRSFRSWLRTVLVNKWRENARRAVPKAGVLFDPNQLAAADESDAVAEAEDRERVVARALRLMRSDFTEPTWRACWECVVAGRDVADVAAELGLTPGAVRSSKFRVLTRLRLELKGLL